MRVITRSQSINAKKEFNQQLTLLLNRCELSFGIESKTIVFIKILQLCNANMPELVYYDEKYRKLAQTIKNKIMETEKLYDSGKYKNVSKNVKYDLLCEIEKSKNTIYPLIVV